MLRYASFKQYRIVYHHHVYNKIQRQLGVYRGSLGEYVTLVSSHSFISHPMLPLFKQWESSMQQCITALPTHLVEIQLKAVVLVGGVWSSKNCG